MQHQSPAALVRAHKLPHCSVLLCKTGSQQALCQCKYTYGDLLFIQVYSDATPMHCSTGQGKMAPLLFSCILQNRLTAALCLCNYTYGDLLFIQMWSDATAVHCSTGQGRIASLLFSAALQTSLTAALCHCNHTYGDLLFIQVCNDARPMHCSTGQGRIATLLSVLCKLASQQSCATAIAPKGICCSYRCAITQDQCTAALVRAE